MPRSSASPSECFGRPYFGSSGKSAESGPSLLRWLLFRLWYGSPAAMREAAAAARLTKLVSEVAGFIAEPGDLERAAAQWEAEQGK